MLTEMDGVCTSHVATGLFHPGARAVLQETPMGPVKRSTVPQARSGHPHGGNGASAAPRS